MIKTSQGRFRSERTNEELEQLLAAEMSSLSDEEQEVLRLVLAEMEESEGEPELLRLMGETEYRRTPVDIRTFVMDPYYLGTTCDGLYPRLLEDLESLFDGGYQEAIWTGSIGYGKTFVSTIGVLRVLYELSCLTSPHKSYGLAEGSNISLLCLSATEELATKVVFENVATKIKASPYFAEYFPSEPTKRELRFPNGVWVAARAATDTASLGLNPICALIDETNFMAKSQQQKASSKRWGHYDQAENLYTAIKRRMDSRFKRNGRLPGMLFLVSSKKTSDDFTAHRIHASSTDPTVFVRDYSLWDVKPAIYSNRMFHVFVGNDRTPSRILNPGEEAEWTEETLPDGAALIEVPEDFRHDFESDLEGCLVAGTKIPLLDGTEVPIEDLVGCGEFWTYSFTSDGYFKPGQGYDARLTRRDAPVIEVILDSGESVRCTPNHPFMLRDGTYRRADELRPADSLMPLYRRKDRYGYEMLKSNVGGRWIHTHSFVAREYFCDGAKIPDEHVVHHKDLTSANNEPLNLKIMLKEDHEALHQQLGLALVRPDVKAKAAKARRLWCAQHPEQAAKNRSAALEAAHRAFGTSYDHRPVAARIGREFGFGSKTPTARQKESRQRNAQVLSEWTKKNNAGESNPAKTPEARRKNSEKTKERMRLVPTETIQDRGRRGCHRRWRHSGVYESCPRCFPTPSNHKVVAVRSAGRADVYDVSIKIWNNLALSAGIVVHNSIRDIAGVATVAVHPFINRRDKIDSAVDATRKHPFTSMELDPSKTGDFIWSEMVSLQQDRWMAGDTPIPRPIVDPQAIRHIHIDPSLTGDCTGFAMGHVAGWKDVVRRADDGRQYQERAPIYYIDVMLRIVPPIGGEIILGDVRRLIYDLSAHGYTISLVSMDSWNSADGMQQLNSKGYKTELISVDKTLAPYENLKDALYEDRIYCYNYPPLLKELRELEKDERHRKVDHPAKGCFTGDTRVRLLDGRRLSFEELVTEFGTGKKFHVYTIWEGRISVGTARNPRLTKKQTPVVAVTLDNGRVARCTPDHLWMLRDGTYCEAAKLVPGSSLMPLYTKLSNKDGLKGYELYLDTSDSKWHFTHRMVGRWKYPTSGYTGNQYGKGIVHHRFGKTNNDPSALELLEDSTEHGNVHREDLLKKRSDPEFEAKRLANLAAYNNDPANRERQAARLRETMKRPEVLRRHAAAVARTGKRTGPANLTAYNKSEAHRKVAAETGKRTIHAAITARTRTDVQLGDLLALRSRGWSNKEIAAHLHASESFVERRFSKVRCAGLIVPDARFTSARPTNHKVVSVTACGFADVYDLTVEETENFALDSGVFVHNSKDVADAVAGCLYTLSRHRVSQPIPIVRGLSGNDDDAWLEEQRQAEYAGNVGASANESLSSNFGMLPAFLVGSGDSPGRGWNPGGGGGGWFPGL